MPHLHGLPDRERQCVADGCALRNEGRRPASGAVEDYAHDGHRHAEHDGHWDDH
ncbi:hypothetical protein HW445_04545 [Streptomyces sp. UH6]|nr:hypothetical protein [Streptomyces sp. UH6]